MYVCMYVCTSTCMYAAKYRCTFPMASYPYPSQLTFNIFVHHMYVPCTCCCLTLPFPIPNTHTHVHTYIHTLQSGLLVVWKVDVHGQLHPVPLHQHRLHAPLTHCEMLHPISTESTKGGSVLENFTWERKSAALMAMSIQDPIACFCATIDGKQWCI